MHGGAAEHALLAVSSLGGVRGVRSEAHAAYRRNKYLPMVHGRATVPRPAMRDLPRARKLGQPLQPYAGWILAEKMGLERNWRNVPVKFFVAVCSLSTVTGGV